MKLFKDTQGSHYIVSETGHKYTLGVVEGTSGKTSLDIVVILFIGVDGTEMVNWHYGLPDDFDNPDEHTLKTWKNYISKFEVEKGFVLDEDTKKDSWITTF